MLCPGVFRRLKKKRHLRPLFKRPAQLRNLLEKHLGIPVEARTLAMWDNVRKGEACGLRALSFGLSLSWV